jgi:hypothetical protein
MTTPSVAGIANCAPSSLIRDTVDLSQEAATGAAFVVCNIQ